MQTQELPLGLRYSSLQPQGCGEGSEKDKTKTRVVTVVLSKWLLQARLREAKLKAKHRQQLLRVSL